jgi:hypothetical protein
VYIFFKKKSQTYLENLLKSRTNSMVSIRGCPIVADLLSNNLIFISFNKQVLYRFVKIFNFAKKKYNKSNKMWNGLLLVLIIFCKGYSGAAFDAVYAVHFGKQNVDYYDSQGVEYKKYTGECSNRLSTPKIFRNVPDYDQTLYQHYCRDDRPNLTVPLSGDGKYLLILKLSPHGSNDKASLTLNNNHKIWSKFSVYATVGALDLAYDEYILFSVCGNRLQYKTELSSIVSSSISLYLYNGPSYSHIAALVLYKGDVHNFKVQPTIAKNFNSNDFDYQSKFECRGNSFFETTTTATTSATATTSTTSTTAIPSTTVKPYTVNNNYFFMNFFINKIPPKSEILSVDEI